MNRVRLIKDIRRASLHNMSMVEAVAIADALLASRWLHEYAEMTYAGEKNRLKEEIRVLKDSRYDLSPLD